MNIYKYMVNLFYLDENPYKCAEYYCNKHVIKIPIEIAMMLCFIHHEENTKAPYKKSKAVKSVEPFKWIKESIENYRYSVNLALALIEEYFYRYDKKEHKTYVVLKWLKENEPNLPLVKKTKFRMTHHKEMYHLLDTDEVTKSRIMYVELKCSNDSWKKRDKPKWFDPLLNKINNKKKKYKKKINKLVNKTLPYIAKKNKFPVYLNHCFRRIIYDNLVCDKWNNVAKTLTLYNEKKKSFIDILTYPMIKKAYEIAINLKKKDIIIKLNNKSLSYR